LRFETLPKGLFHQWGPAAILSLCRSEWFRTVWLRGRQP